MMTLSFRATAVVALLSVCASAQGVTEPGFELNLDGDLGYDTEKPTYPVYVVPKKKLTREDIFRDAPVAAFRKVFRMTI